MLSVTTPTKKDVACGIMFYGNQILMGRRSLKSDNPGIWEFPGGKQELNETLHQCLHREWEEELNLKIKIVDEIAVLKSNGFKCHFYIGIIEDMTSLKVRVHDNVQLLYLDEIYNLNLFPEDYDVVKMISYYLPQLQR